jgi:hypothetical protein
LCEGGWWDEWHRISGSIALDWDSQLKWRHRRHPGDFFGDRSPSTPAAAHPRDTPQAPRQPKRRRLDGDSHYGPSSRHPPLAESPRPVPRTPSLLDSSTSPATPGAPSANGRRPASQTVCITNLSHLLGVAPQGSTPEPCSRGPSCHFLHPISTLSREAVTAQVRASPALGLRRPGAKEALLTALAQAPANLFA